MKHKALLIRAAQVCNGDARRKAWPDRSRGRTDRDGMERPLTRWGLWTDQPRAVLRSSPCGHSNESCIVHHPAGRGPQKALKAGLGFDASGRVHLDGPAITPQHVIKPGMYPGSAGLDEIGVGYRPAGDDLECLPRMMQTFLRRGFSHRMRHNQPRPSTCRQVSPSTGGRELDCADRALIICHH